VDNYFSVLDLAGFASALVSFLVAVFSGAISFLPGLHIQDIFQLQHQKKTALLQIHDHNYYTHIDK
jgi:hypothetical protein